MGSIDPTTPIIAVGIIVALLVFCGYTIFTRQSTDDDQDENSSTRPIDPGRSRGLDSTLIETFPAFIYSEVKHLMIGKGAMECAVCLNDFEDIETLKLLPKCDHVFHSECIGKWLSARTTSPVCRDDLAEPDAHKQAHVVSDTSSVDRSSITIEVAEESVVDEGGWKKSASWSTFPR